MPDVILVTGGFGLVGQGIKYVIENEPEGSRFGKRAGETWIFASSSEADLKYVTICLTIPKVLTCSEGILIRPRSSSRNTSLHMSFTSPRSVCRSISDLPQVVLTSCVVGGLFKNMKYKVRHCVAVCSCASLLTAAL